VRSVAFVFMVAHAACAQAASIVIESLGPNKPMLVMIQGTIVENDAEQFRLKVNDISAAVVGFQSDGGNLISGLSIGETIRLRNFTTIVPENARCASACALAWLGGTQRFMGSGARIGFHAAYNVESGQETGVGNALVGAYLTRIGLPISAVVYITKASPDSMTWLGISEARQHGIDVTLLDPLMPSRQANTQPTPSNQDDLAGRASGFAAQMFSEWSQPNSYVSRYLSGLYGEQVSYYGQTKSRQAVLADKLRFIERWPERSYKLRPGSISVQCILSSFTCNVAGVVDWQASNQKRAASSSGISAFSYTFIVREGITIVSETSTVTTRSSETGPTPQRSNGPLDLVPK